MKERGIIMQGESVQGILPGLKTMTRRIVQLRKDRDFGCSLLPNELAGEVNAGYYGNCPYGQPGDRLWVREAWRVGKPHDNKPPRDIWPASDGRGVTVLYEAGGWLDKGGNVIYQGNEPMPEWAGRYRNARFMPRWASRILLEITEIRIERLQEISEEDAIAEGCFALGDYECTAVRQYQELWGKINGDGSWDANPYVWVISFRRVEP